MSLRRRVTRQLFALDLWRVGETQTLAFLERYEASQHHDRERLEGDQLAALQAIVGHAERACPYYAQRFAEYGVRADGLRSLADLAAFPILDKADIQTHREALLAQSWPADDRLDNFTGGSTGQPLALALDRACKCARHAATLRHNRWAGWEIGDPVAHIWSAAMDLAPDTPKARLRNALIDRALAFNSRQISDEALERFCREWQRFRPRVVHAYAGSGALVARYAEAHGIELPPPVGVVTSAETLLPDDRAVIERVFGAPVFDRYGSREVSVIASECEAHDGLHVMAEGLYVELVVDGRPARSGERGAIVVTDLRNKAMPLIRYRIGDIARFAEGDCACGRALPRLAALEGRITDFLVGADGRQVAGPYLLTYLVGQCPEIGQAQFVQSEVGKVVLRVTRVPSEESRVRIDTLCRDSLGDDAEIAIEVVDEIPRGPSGKWILSQSTVETPYSNRPRASTRDA